MRLPQINTVEDSTSMISSFMGINKGLRIQDNEFTEMKNMTNDHYPAITNRQKRGIVTTFTKPMGIHGGRHLTIVDDNKLYYDDALITNLSATNNERKIVMMGALLCVFPDGVIYNTSTETVSYIDNVVTTTSNPTLTLCRLDGTNYDDTNTVTSNTAPSDKTKNWIDTSANPVVIKAYSESEAAWVSIGTTYVKIGASGIGNGFKAYDAATLSGIDSSAGYNGYDFNQTNIIYDCGADFIVVAGLINKVYTNSKPVTVSRKHPEMDFICEQDNRLWGCSSDNHEVYACKQGDPTNWNFFGGLDSDSYAATIGTQDMFTGACSYYGTVYFFKENGYHKLMGNKPSNYQMIWKSCRGIQKGSEKSLTMVDEVLMWKAKDAIVKFDGNIETVSQNLGANIPYFDAVGGNYRNKYYVTMRDEEYNFKMYVYDLNQGTWVVEDDMYAQFMANTSEGFYIIDNFNQLMVVNIEHMYVKNFPSDDIYPDSNLYPGNVHSGTTENTVVWSLTSADIGLDSPFHKYIKRIDARIAIDSSATIKFAIEYDSCGAWTPIMEFTSTRKKSYTIPLKVARCDHMKLKMSGHGDVKLYSLAIIREEGSDGNI